MPSSILSCNLHPFFRMLSPISTSNFHYCMQAQRRRFIFAQFWPRPDEKEKKSAMSSKAGTLMIKERQFGSKSIKDVSCFFSIGHSGFVAGLQQRTVCDNARHITWCNWTEPRRSSPVWDFLELATTSRRAMIVADSKLGARHNSTQLNWIELNWSVRFGSSGSVASNAARWALWRMIHQLFGTRRWYCLSV
jgi:hypothetical protein